MKSFISLSLFCCAALSASQPNFIFILSDDQDWTETSVQMHPDIPTAKSQYIETPHLVQLAEEGMVFSAAYAPAPVCSPTRISLQTGKSPAQLHWTKAGPIVSASDNLPLLPQAIRKSISTEELTIAEMLKSAGYATAHYGKWHLSGGGPEQHGYDASDGDTGNKDAAPHVAPNPVDIFGITERACDFIEKQSQQGTPFYIQLSHHALHYPENAAPVLLQKYATLSGGSTGDKKVQRMAMAEHLDTSVGLIMEKIDALGLADKTYLIYMSDNGGGGGGVKAGKQSGGGHSRPLNGGKGSLGEGGIRVPLIIRGPTVKAGVYCSTRVVGYDLFPTLCKKAGVSAVMPVGIEGGDLSSIFSEGSGSVQRPDRGLVFHFPHYQGDTPHSSIILGDYKLTKWYEDGRVRLYDLSKDIGEQRDLAIQRPEQAQELLSELERRLRALDAQLPVVNPNYDSTKPSTNMKKGGSKNKGRSRALAK